MGLCGRLRIAKPASETVFVPLLVTVTLSLNGLQESPVIWMSPGTGAGGAAIVTMTFEGSSRLSETLIHAWHSSGLVVSNTGLAMPVLIGLPRSSCVSNVVTMAERRFSEIVAGWPCASMITPPPASRLNSTLMPSVLLNAAASQNPSRSRRWATTYLYCGVSPGSMVTALYPSHVHSVVPILLAIGGYFPGSWR